MMEGDSELDLSLSAADFAGFDCDFDDLLTTSRAVRENTTTSGEQQRRLHCIIDYITHSD